MFSSMILILSISLAISDSLAQINPSKPVFKSLDSIRRITREARSRDERKVEFEFDGQQYKFNFVQSDRQVYDLCSPVWIAKSVPGGNPNYTYQIVENSDRFIRGHFYIDNDKQAVAYVHYDEINKKILYDGVFGEGNESHVIKSLTHNNPRLRSLSGDYLIYKIEENSNAVHVHSSVKTRMNWQLWQETLETPLTTFYPKILAVVDNHLFRKLGNDIAATVKYVATFWNVVDLRFIELDSPKVQFVLTGIIIAEDETALNYVYQSRYTPKDIDEDEQQDKADADLMKEKTRLYFHHNFSSDIKDFENYDAAVVLTGLDTYPIGGVTDLGKICDDWYNVAIVADNGEFSGTRTAAHELSHLLNVQHDSLSKDDKCYSLADDDSVSLMSPIQKETNNVFWSECSKKYLNDFSKVKAAQCLETRSRTRDYPEDRF